jgi:hypothetical protein
MRPADRWSDADLQSAQARIKTMQKAVMQFQEGLKMNGPSIRSAAP